MLPQRHDKIESLPTEKMAWHAVSGFTKLGLSRENCAADAPSDADRVPAASLANLTPDPPAGTKRNSKRVGTYPRQRPRTAAASSPFPSSLRRDTSRRHRRYDIWVSQHQCRRDILQGWLSRTPLKWNSLVQGYRHTLYSAPLFPPGRGWGPFLAPSLSVQHFAREYNSTHLGGYPLLSRAISHLLTIEISPSWALVNRSIKVVRSPHSPLPGSFDFLFLSSFFLLFPVSLSLSLSSSDRLAVACCFPS